jgi:hypothetical protein
MNETNEIVQTTLKCVDINKNTRLKRTPLYKRVNIKNAESVFKFLGIEHIA